MKYRIATWCFKEEFKDSDLKTRQEKYKRRLGKNDWVSLLSENQQTNLSAYNNIIYDNIVDAEIEFDRILNKGGILLWSEFRNKPNFRYNDWEYKMQDEFDNCSYQSIKKLLSDAYELALEDTDCEKQYTHLVLHNLQLIAKEGIESITFRQWKSFRAYVKVNSKPIINDIKEFLK
jgi:hypothetical protein